MGLGRTKSGIRVLCGSRRPEPADLALRSPSATAYGPGRGAAGAPPPCYSRMRSTSGGGCGGLRAAALVGIADPGGRGRELYNILDSIWFCGLSPAPLPSPPPPLGAPGKRRAQMGGCGPHALRARPPWGSASQCLPCVPSRCLFILSGGQGQDKRFWFPVRTLVTKIGLDFAR